MINTRKNSSKYSICAILLMALMLLTSDLLANYHYHKTFDNSLTAFQDTARFRVARDTIPGLKDSLVNTTDTFGLKISKDSLDAPIQYEAADSMAFDIPNKRVILYSKGKITYKDIVLTADSISLEQSTSIITAKYRRDSLGNIIGRPNMIQGETDMTSDLIRYNIKTQKGITTNTFTTQQELFLNMQNSKKVSENEYFARIGRMTTCNLDTPHFAFIANRMKLVNKKLAVTGPVHPEFEGVPIPIYLPFGFFPLSSGRHSGLLAPQFTTSEQFGLGLEGLGSYKVINDYFDVTLRTNLYSYGGYNIYVTPTYRKRYRYTGSLNLAYQSTRILTTDAKSEFQTSKTFNVGWNHSMDNRARPGTNFGASVNAGSTKFNQFVANNPTRNFANQLSSSITYSKTFGTIGNLSLSANHSQNNNTRLINVSLPNAAFTLNTFYPFQKKEFVGEPKWYEKLGIGLNSNIANQLSFYDSAFSFRRIIDTIQWGAMHSVPIQMSLPPLGPLQIAPGISYQEKWYSRKLLRTWNDTRKKIDTAFDKGFYTSRDISFSLGLNTAIFGLFDRFGKNSRVAAIRHVIRPSASISYKPDLARKDYYNQQIDSTGRQYRFSYFEGTVFGPFGEGEFGGISFGVDNNIEAKVRSKTDTSAGSVRKVRLLDGFGFNGSYNFLADSFQLSPLTFYARSTLFEIINITGGATLDPYGYDDKGFRTSRYSWQGDKFSVGNISSANLAISATFQSKKKDESKKKQDQAVADANLPQQTMEEQMLQLEYVRQNPAEFVDFEVPWSVSLSYSLSYSRQFRPDYSGFRSEIFSSLNATGDFSLTPKWKLGMSGYYDFKSAKIQSLTTFITREMHCWQLSINVTPIGLYRSFNITLNPKSGLLRDLRVNRTRYFYGT
ncbi:MAG: LPS-assembly protein LptD [Chitinophagaceae bacterium]|nr:LPS-assembly protein LptD [Chitinophagaceae bacterium]